ncbi:MAG: hypothetical protein K1Y36_11520 [Blastocatellia bacterium]|nr:hypothetical protein [Blastocatellia bacterium]
MAAPELSFKSELRRGVNAFNLAIGGAVGTGAGLVMFLLVRFWGADFPFGGSSWTWAGGTGCGVFIFTTGLHTAVHAYYGWRFEHGMRAAQQGKYQEAERLLRVVERPGMAHYDEAGLARQALLASRIALQESHHSSRS